MALTTIPFSMGALTPGGTPLAATRLVCDARKPYATDGEEVAAGRYTWDVTTGELDNDAEIVVGLTGSFQLYNGTAKIFSSPIVGGVPAGLDSITFADIVSQEHGPADPDALYLRQGDPPSRLGGTGYSVGQVPTWNGTTFAPGAGSSFTQEQIEDIVGGMFDTPGANITYSYDDASGNVTVTGENGFTEEEIEDIIAGFAAQGSNVTITYDDTANTLTIAATGGTVADGSITNAKLATAVKVGNLPDLTTTDKSSVTAAINEVKALTGAASGGSTLFANTSIGATSLTITNAATYDVGDVIVIQGRSLDCEVRRILEVSSRSGDNATVVIDMQAGASPHQELLYAHSAGVEIEVYKHVGLLPIEWYGVKAYNVRESGPGGVGTAYHGADNSTGIQRALNEAANQGFGGITAGPGTYYMASQVVVPQESAIQGFHMTQTIFKADPDFELAEDGTDYMFTMDRNPNGLLEHGLGYQNARVYYDRFKVDANEIDGLGGIAITCQQPGFMSNVRIDGVVGAPGILVATAQQFSFFNIMMIGGGSGGPGMTYGFDCWCGEYLWFQDINIERVDEAGMRFRGSDPVPAAGVTIINFHVEAGLEGKYCLDAEYFSGWVHNLWATSGDMSLVKLGTQSGGLFTHLSTASPLADKVMIEDVAAGVTVTATEVGGFLNSYYHGVHTGSLTPEWTHIEYGADGTEAWLKYGAVDEGSQGFINARRPDGRVIVAETEVGSAITATATTTGKGVEAVAEAGGSAIHATAETLAGRAVVAKGPAAVGVHSEVTRDGAALVIEGTVQHVMKLVTAADLETIESVDGFYVVEEGVGRICVMASAFDDVDEVLIWLPLRSTVRGCKFLVEDWSGLPGTAGTSGDRKIRVGTASGTSIMLETGSSPGGATFPIAIEKPLGVIEAETDGNIYRARFLTVP